MTQNAKSLKSFVVYCFQNANILNLEGSDILNSVIFPYSCIVKFDFSSSAGGVNLSLLNVHTISGTSVSNYIEIL